MLATINAALPATIDRRPLSFLASEFFRRQPAFTSVAIFLAMLALPTAFAAFVDQRTLHGIDLWIKPLKFEAALFVYLLTLAWFAGWLCKGLTQRRWFRIYIYVVVSAILLEIAWIVGAAAFGTASHFNTSSAFMEVLYPFMGVGAVVLTSASLVFGVAIARNEATGLPPAFKASVVYGLILTFVLTLITAGYMSSTGSHLVGGNISDVEATPIFGWARDGGDLRVAHLFATHAMHALPIFGLVSIFVFGRESLLPLRIFTLAYIALVAFTFVQALMGLPFLPMIG